jgi:uncharacterized repeat protein (TIGR01451 family)
MHLTSLIGCGLIVCGLVGLQGSPGLPPPPQKLPAPPKLVQPDLVADMAGSPSAATFGQDIVYQAHVRNAGTGDVSNVVLKMQLPREVNFVRADNNTAGSCLQSGQASAAGGVFVTCTKSLLSVGAVASVAIVTRPIAGLSDNISLLFTLTVDPDHAIAESNETNNTAVTMTTLRVPIDLAITSIAIEKLGSGSFLAPNLIPLPPAPMCSQGSTTVRIHVVNNGPGGSPATKLGFTWAGGISPALTGDCPHGTLCDTKSGACMPGPAVLPPSACFDSCDVPSLLPGMSADVVVKVFQPANATDLGVATVDPSHAVSDPIPANNSRHIQ